MCWNLDVSGGLCVLRKDVSFPDPAVSKNQQNFTVLVVVSAPARPRDWDGLALGGCLLVAVLATAIFVWHRKHRIQPPPGSSTRGPRQVEVTVAEGV